MNEIAIILSSEGILFHDDSTFVQKLHALKEILVFHIFIIWSEPVQFAPFQEIQNYIKFHLNDNSS